MQSITNEQRIIHDSLHSKASSFYLGRKKYEIGLDSEGRRYVDYENIRYVQQPINTTMYNRKAHYREKITWCIPHDESERVFVIDATVLIQPVNAAVIGILIEKPKENAGDKVTKTKRGKRKLGGK